MVQYDYGHFVGRVCAACGHRDLASTLICEGIKLIKAHNSNIHLSTIFTFRNNHGGMTNRVVNNNTV